MTALPVSEAAWTADDAERIASLKRCAPHMVGRVRGGVGAIWLALAARPPAPSDAITHPGKYLVRVEKPGGLRFYECSAPTLDEAAEGVGLQRRAAPSEGARDAGTCTLTGSPRLFCSCIDCMRAAPPEQEREADAETMTEQERLILDLTVALKDRIFANEQFGRHAQELVDRGYAMVEAKLPKLSDLWGIAPNLRAVDEENVPEACECPDCQIASSVAGPTATLETKDE